MINRPNQRSYGSSRTSFHFVDSVRIALHEWLYDRIDRPGDPNGIRIHYSAYGKICKVERDGLRRWQIEYSCVLSHQIMEGRSLERYGIDHKNCHGLVSERFPYGDLDDNLSIDQNLNPV